jgi:hypothetical protein
MLPEVLGGLEEERSRADDEPGNFHHEVRTTATTKRYII